MQTYYQIHIIDKGFEFLLGKRKDKEDAINKAKQIQTGRSSYFTDRVIVKKITMETIFDEPSIAKED